MIERIWVQVGGDDRRVPREQRGSGYFEPGKPHNVRLTPFIQRRLDDKDLVKVDAPPEPAPAAAEVAAEAVHGAVEMPIAAPDTHEGA